MSETYKRSHNTTRTTKIAAGITAVTLGLGLGVVAKRGVSAENSFKTDIPVPTETQPHIDYTVRAGDTEESITQRFDTRYGQYDYENMINAQLPKKDQPDRNLQPGERLNLPSK